MVEKRSTNWGMKEHPALEGNPFEIARPSCRHAVQIAKDVTIDPNAMNRFVGQLDIDAIHMNETFNKNPSED